MEEAVSIAALSEERLRLEREAFEIERSRLEAARQRAEAELKAARTGHPFLVFASVALLAVSMFAGGMLLGLSLSESRQQRLREARLREALSQLGGLAETVTTTNAAPGGALRPGGGESQRNVSVVVIQ